MRRRAAKLLTCIKADSFEYQGPDMQASGDLAGDVTVELERLACQLQSSMTESSSAGQSHHIACTAFLESPVRNDAPACICSHRAELFLTE